MFGKKPLTDRQAKLRAAQERFVCTFWGRDFYLPELLVRDKRFADDSAAFFMSKDFRRFIKRQFRRLEKYGIINFFWNSEEAEVLIDHMKKFLKEFERSGKIAMFTDYQKKNFVVLYPETNFMKYDFDYGLCTFVKNHEYRKKNKKTIYWKNRVAAFRRYPALKKLNPGFKKRK
jgi:hypothetical protein